MHKTPLETVRADTPGCEHLLHFNNAGASLQPSIVIDAMKQHLDLEATLGGYEAAEAAANPINQLYENAAKLIHCDPDEIAFMENSTRAWDMAFYSFKFALGDRILTCRSEYASNYLALLHMAKMTGVKIDIIQDDHDGQLDLADLSRQLNDKVKLIAITHVPSQGGLINPAKEVGAIANKMQIPFLLDATQSIGQMPIDVNVLGCDLLCATGRKYLRGPRGTGFLYVRKTTIHNPPPFIDLHSADWVTDNDYTIKSNARRFETWEQNIAAKIGLGVAIGYALNIGIPLIWERIQQLATQLRKELSQIPSLKLQDQGLQKCGIVTFTSKNKSASEIKQALAKHKINVSISLQEYARLDLAKRNIPSLVRCSVHYYNTEEEITRFCYVLNSLLYI